MSTQPQTAELLFSGDWEWDADLDCYDTAYEAVAFGSFWNGFATPIVSRNVMIGFAARQQMLQTSGEYVDIIHADGNGFYVDDEDEERTWLLPDADGNFDLGRLGWTFQQVDRSEDNIVRVIPSEVTR
jgi:hypothetical protein